MKNEHLVDAFAAVMERNGQPVELIPDDRNPGELGPPTQAFRRTTDCRTIRLITSNKDKSPALMALPKGYRRAAHGRAAIITPFDAPFRFEDQDFVAFVYRTPDNKARVYLMESPELAKHLRQRMKEWMDHSPNHDPNNRTFVLNFCDKPKNSDLPNYNYHKNFAEHFVGEIDLEPTVAQPARTASSSAETFRKVIEQKRREIADAVGVAPDAVGITIKFA